MKQKHIYRLIFFFVMAFALGSLVGKIYSHFTSNPRSDPNSAKSNQTSSASMTFQNENWGSVFRKKQTAHRKCFYGRIKKIQCLVCSRYR